jgi:hypothetical protein
MDPRAGLDFLNTRKISYPCRRSNPFRQASVLVTILTTLYRFSHYYYYYYYYYFHHHYHIIIISKKG